MKRFICIFLSLLMLLLCVGCDTSSDKNTSVATTTATTPKPLDNKEKSINEWEPLTLSAGVQEDLSEIEGETIEFKPLGYIDGRFGYSKLISNLDEIVVLEQYVLSVAYNCYEYPYANNQLTDEQSTEVQNKVLTQIREIDFNTYSLLVCPVDYSSSDLGFEGEPLIRLLNRDNKLYCVFQSNWSGGEIADDIRGFNALVLVKKADWTLGEDISSASALIYNKNNKAVGGCYHSGVYTTTSSLDYKNDPINQWSTLTLPADIQKDLSAVEGAVIEFKTLGYVNSFNDFMLIDSAEQLYTIDAWQWDEYPWAGFYSSDSTTQTRGKMISQLRKIDFETYYLLVCPIKYAPNDCGFEGEPLIRLLNRDNKLYYVVQSDWGGGGYDQLVGYFSALILVKKADWTLGDDISAELLVYNKDHKDVGACYRPSGSIFK